MCMEIKVALGVNGQMMRTEVAAGSSVCFFVFWGLELSSPTRSHILCRTKDSFVSLFFFFFYLVGKYLEG